MKKQVFLQGLKGLRPSACSYNTVCDELMHQLSMNLKHVDSILLKWFITCKNIFGVPLNARASNKSAHVLSSHTLFQASIRGRHSCPQTGWAYSSFACYLLT